MNQRTTSSRDGKPDKPRPDFPLFPHATKRWAKKIRGKLHYFGPWDDPQSALERYLDQKDDLHAGRIPRPANGDAVLIRDILNHFLTAKKHLLDSGEITARTWADYRATCERMRFQGTVLRSRRKEGERQGLDVAGFGDKATTEDHQRVGGLA